MGRLGGAALVGALAALAACSDEDAGGSGAPECEAGETAECTCEGGDRGRAICVDGSFAPCECLGPVTWRFVTSALRLPETAAEVRSLGFDLDGDGTVDNALGSLLMMSGSSAGAGDAVASGQLIQLHVLDVAGSGEGTWTWYAGEPTPAPDFSGNGSFTVAPGATGTLEGALADGTFRGGPAPLVLSLPFGDGAIPLALDRVALEAAVAVDGCQGKLGGAVPIGDFEELFVPGVATAVNALIAADPGCQAEPPACSPELQAILALLDADGDLEITPEELLANPFFTAMVRPDVDLNGDGEADGFGIGLGFTCVRARFDVP